LCVGVGCSFGVGGRLLGGGTGTTGAALGAVGGVLRRRGGECYKSWGGRNWWSCGGGCASRKRQRKKSPPPVSAKEGGLEIKGELGAMPKIEAGGGMAGGMVSGEGGWCGRGDKGGGSWEAWQREGTM